MTVDNLTRHEAMHIALAADANFVMPLAVTLASLAHNHSPDDLAVTIVHDGIGVADRTRIVRGAAADLDVNWLQIDMSELAEVHHMPSLGKATLFRLLLPSLLPRSLKRAIYLDCDIVVARPLRPLWELDLEDHLLGAVRDAGAPFPAGPYGTDWRALGLAPDTPYFNAGMLVIPLDVWRAADVSERSIDLLRRSQPRWGDQDALNATVQGDWKELPRRWNLQTPDAEGRGLAWALWRDDVEAALDDAAVIHYTESVKPWDPGAPHPLADQWLEVLKGTAWRDWQPGPSARHLPRRIGSRTKRAWRVLARGAPGTT